jgi:hypothetical protein
MPFNIGDLIYIGAEYNASVFEVLELWDTGGIKSIKRVGDLDSNGDLVLGKAGGVITCDTVGGWDDLGWAQVVQTADNSSPYYKVIRKIKQMDQRRKVKGYAF